MDTKRVAAILGWAVWFATGLSGLAQAQADPNAETVFLQKDCSGTSNCFTVTRTLTDWITQIRQPSQGKPLLVQVGPGEFDPLLCGSPNPFIGGVPGYSHVTFQGAGRSRTVFTANDCSPDGLTPQCGAIHVASDQCGDLEFLDLTAKAGANMNWGAMWWGKAGNSLWNNVDVIGGRVGWYEFTGGGLLCNIGAARGIHYWFNSRISAVQPDGFALVGYQANCGESWLYGSDILAVADPNLESALLGDGIAGLLIGATSGDVRVFGSTIRVAAQGLQDGVILPGGDNEGIAGVRVYGNGIFHMHGGIINVTAPPTTPNPVYGLKVANGGFAHTPGTAFVVRGGAIGQTARLSGSAQSPFLQPPGASPPRANPSDPNSALLSSTIGSDLFVETDCDPNGNCDGAGTQTHLMISNPACGAANPWFDVVTGSCRQD